jgi:predicted O-methyltransferase YrrM
MAIPHEAPPHPRPPAASMTDLFVHLQWEYRDSLRRRYGDKHDSEAMIHHAVEGAIKIFDALAIAEVLKASRPARILEVGSYLGFSTRWILEATAAIGSSVTSVDPRVRHRIFDGVKEHLLAFCALHAPRLACVDAYLTDRNDDMFLDYYLNYEPRVSEADARAHLARVPVIDKPFDEFDFAFIDGDHGFRATVLNVHLAAAMLPAGGCIMVHDALTWPEVMPALMALCGRRSGLAVEGIAGEAFHAQFANPHDAYHLSNGVAIVRVYSPQLVRRFDPCSLLP